MKLNARDEVVAEAGDISVNGATVRVSVFQGYALRGLPVHTPTSDLSTLALCSEGIARDLGGGFNPPT